MTRNNFLGDLVVRELTGGTAWEVYEPFTYHLCQPDGVQFVRIDKGFVTDFASIPRGLWNLWPPNRGKHAKPAVVHDCLYKTGYVSVEGGGQRRITRGEADAIFLEAMEVAGVGWLSRRLIYAGVRAGGWRAWGTHRHADATS